MRDRHRVYPPFGLHEIFSEQIGVFMEIEQGQDSEEKEATNYSSYNSPPTIVHSQFPVCRR